MSGSAGRRSGILAAAGVIAITTLLARVFGFGRWLVFSHSVGATCVGEAYATANQLPNVLFEVAAGGALAAVAVPLVAGALARGDRESADRTASALLTWAVSVLVPLSVLLALAARPLANLLLSERSDLGCRPDSQLDLAVSMLIVFAPQVPLYGLGIVLAGVLQAHRRFLAAALAPLLSSLVVIAAYATYGQIAAGDRGDPAKVSDTALAVLAGGTTLGVVALSVPLIVPVLRAGVRLRPTWRFPEGQARRAAQLAGSGLLALVAQQVTVLATVWAATHRGGEGAVNVYAYIQALYLLPYAVLCVPLATAAFPSLVAEGEEQRRVSGQTLSRTLRAIIAAGALGATVLIAVALPAGRFFAALDASGDSGEPTSIGALQPGLVAYAGGVLGFSVIALLQRAVYARGRAWWGAGIVAAGWLVAALLPLLVLREGAGSDRTLTVLGAGSTLGMTVAAGGLVWLVAREWGADVVRPSARTTVAAVVAAAVGAAAGTALSALIDPHGLVAAAVTGLAAAVLAAIVFAAVLQVADPRTGSALRARLSRSRARSLEKETL